MKLLSITTLSTWVLLVAHCEARCLICEPSGNACVSEVQFAPCSQGVVQLNSIQLCSANTVCVNGACQSAGAPTCRVCNECTSTTGFACTSANTFFDCANEVDVVCTGNQQCYPNEPLGCSAPISSPQVQCLFEPPATESSPSSTSSESESSSSSSSSSVAPTTSTPRPTVPDSYAQDYCQRRKQTGNYASPRVTNCSE